ncbi:MAG: hypothetical protein CSA76_05660 [Spirochaetales bacterium]|nr:MAG: hypothetical protein CSA76_05660 [Spirochaetales bacterium]
MKGVSFVAGRIFLRGRRERRQGYPLAGAALGIALSLIPLVTVDHVADAMIDGIIARYRETSSFHFQVYTHELAGAQSWEKNLHQIQEQGDVESAWIERQGFGLARAGDFREGLTLRALPPELYEQNASFASFIQFDSGTWNLKEKNSILLGREAARRLNAQTGDTLRVLTARLLPDGRYVPRVSRFKVGGIFSSGYQDLDRTWAFIPLERGWKILSDESSTTFVGGCFTGGPAEASVKRERIAAGLPDTLRVYSWRELNRFLLSNLENTRSILLFLMAIIIIVAVVNVLSSLVMLTLERRREIGILKCTGTSPAQITFTFILAGLMASAAGTAAGLGGGLLASRFINEIISGIEHFLDFFSRFTASSAEHHLLDEEYYLQYIPVQMRWKSVGIIGCATLFLSFLAAALPSWRSSRVAPLEVLRKH